MDAIAEAHVSQENGHSKAMGESVATEDTQKAGPIVRQKSILKTASSSSIDGDRLKRAVSWQDFDGKELHEVREFEPSVHESEEEETESKKDGACCVIC